MRPFCLTYQWAHVHKTWRSIPASRDTVFIFPSFFRQFRMPDGWKIRRFLASQFVTFTEKSEKSRYLFWPQRANFFLLLSPLDKRRKSKEREFFSYFLLDPFIGLEMVGMGSLPGESIPSMLYPNPFCLVPSHLIPSHFVPSHLISSHLVPSHLFSSHLILSHFKSSSFHMIP